MKPKTRDNLIYVAVGLCVLAFVVEQDFYAANHHGSVIINLSRFAVRVVGSAILVVFYVGRAIRNQGQRLSKVVLFVVLAGVLQTAISVALRQYVEQLPTMHFVSFAALEIFLVVELVTRLALYDGQRQRRTRHSGR